MSIFVLLFFMCLCNYPPFIFVFVHMHVTFCCFLCGLLAGSTADMDALWELYPRRLSEAGLTRHSGI